MGASLLLTADWTAEKAVVTFETIGATAVLTASLAVLN